MNDGCQNVTRTEIGLKNRLSSLVISMDAKVTNRSKKSKRC